MTSTPGNPQSSPLSGPSASDYGSDIDLNDEDFLLLLENATSSVSTAATPKLIPPARSLSSSSTSDYSSASYASAFESLRDEARDIALETTVVIHSPRSPQARRRPSVPEATHLFPSASIRESSGPPPFLFSHSFTHSRSSHNRPHLRPHCRTSPQPQTSN